MKAEDKFDKELKKEQKKAKKRELKEAKQVNDKRNVGAKLVRYFSTIFSGINISPKVLNSSCLQQEFFPKWKFLHH